MVHASMENLLAALVMSVHGVSVKTRSFLQLVRWNGYNLDSISGTLCGLSRITEKLLKLSLVVNIRLVSAGCMSVLVPTFASLSCRVPSVAFSFSSCQIGLLLEPSMPPPCRSLSGLPICACAAPPESMTHAWYKFYAFVKPEPWRLVGVVTVSLVRL